MAMSLPGGMTCVVVMLVLCKISVLDEPGLGTKVLRIVLTSRQVVEDVMRTEYTGADLARSIKPYEACLYKCTGCPGYTA